jgi:glycogen(starch) synthase
MVSVVINTDGRARALGDTISGLSRMNYPNFEVCIVCGPTPDGTREYVSSLGSTVKTANCEARNLSMSRNIGIKLAAGEIVAFIDDDGIPEPEWLDELAPAFRDPRVGAAGGVVYNHTGYEFQYLYAACDRLGNAIIDLQKAADELNYPFTRRFPYVQGTNSAFRRSALLDIGGFDEEYEFYLDETDVCCRMVDRGLLIRQLPNARVHHKFLPSSIRDNNKITVKKYAVIKNKIYFSFVNNHGHNSNTEIVTDALRFVNAQRADLEFHIHGGRLQRDALTEFEVDADRAWKVGLARGLDGARRTRPADWFGIPDPFRPLPILEPEGGRRTFVFLSQNYPPGNMGGNARHTSDIARAIADLGHGVHVLTHGEAHNRVDLEEGVWVHRIPPKAQPARRLPDGATIPGHIWNYSATMLEEALRINRARRVDVVEGVSWDCETAAFVLDGRFPTATNIVTSLAHWLDTHEELASDAKWMHAFGQPMLALERLVYENSDCNVAASQAIVASLAEYYGASFLPDAVAECQHGLEDMRPLPARQPALLAPAGGDVIRVLFVGRLELRKGIDVLLEAAVRLLDSGHKVEFWVAGDDSLVTRGGLTEKARFLGTSSGRFAAEHIRFLGPVSDVELHWLYGNCDIFVAPSRFESFGLIFVEAMMFAKPVVGCDAGGIGEVVSDGETGLLVPPGDASALAAAIATLVTDAELRSRLGRAGRVTYDARFAAPVVAQRRIKALLKFARDPVVAKSIEQGGASRMVDVGLDEQGVFLEPSSSLTYSLSGRRLYVTLLCHAWSGIAEFHVDGKPHSTCDLFSPDPVTKTVCIATPQPGAKVCVSRSGRKNPKSNSTEVILIAAGER